MTRRRSIKRDFHFCLDELGLVCAYKVSNTPYPLESLCNNRQVGWLTCGLLTRLPSTLLKTTVK